jgi:hypothetical protein
LSQERTLVMCSRGCWFPKTLTFELDIIKP